MRQVGVLAAAARIGLRDRDRLAEDHQLAKMLASGLADRYPGAVDLDGVQTNMVMVDEAVLPFPPGALPVVLGESGVRVDYVAPGLLRFATHQDVDRRDVERLLAALDQATV